MMAKRMSAAKNLVRLLVLVQVAAGLLAGPGGSVAALSMDYYGMSCPFAEMMVRSVVYDALTKDPTLAGSLLRLHFHDCFVQGCDASVLIDSTDGNTAEKDALANKSLRGFEVIDRIKEVLESQCPGIVSCADILALAARDAVFLARGPYYGVPLGRRDGTRSLDSDTFTALPPPFFNTSSLIKLFGSHGFTVQDLVALSGGHTLGIAHCANFKARLTETDTLDATLGSSLGATCTANGDAGTAPFDRTSTRFDTVYYRELQLRRGLLSSDQTLFESPETKGIVNMFAMNQAYFFYAFQQGMLKMGQLDLKEGDEGEIRYTCRVINS
jgi:peroxidase